jgi:hypothetical protein
MKPFGAFLVLIFFLFGTQVHGQQLLKGVISDEHGISIPYAKLYVKNAAENRTIADASGYYEMRLFQGEYFLVITAEGFDNSQAYVTINDVTVTKDYQLFPTKFMDMEDVEASAKKSNPGRDIMLKVVQKRDSINPWNYSHTVQGYTKATENIERFESKSDKRKRDKQENEEEEVQNTDPSGIEDPFAEQRKENEEFSNNMNLIEVDFTRHYGGRFDIKEIRNAYKERVGKQHSLYYTTTVKSNFNFFENLLHLDDLHQTPVSSPISIPGILSYKYRLEDQYEENGQKIHKIKIIPRTISTTTLEGYVYVIDSIWLIQKLDLTMEKGNLLVYDYFSIHQEFDHPGDSICVLSNQVLEYGVKYKDQASTCTTVTNFSDYNFNPNFPAKFFNNELSVTEQSAYDKDSTYWKEKRKTELSPEEAKYIAVRDSIYDYQHRTEYLDSVDKVFNKVTALKVLWFGIDHRNRSKKTQWSISSVAGLLRPIYIAGPRVAPSFSYFKKWNSERTFDSDYEVSIGILNADIKGSMGLHFRYDPYHFGTAHLKFSHDFDAIRGYDAITQIYKRDNFIEVTNISFGNDYELVNGLYLDAEYSFTERRSIKGYKFLDTDDFLPNNDPTEFESYQASIFEATLSYIPNQKFMREPKRKVVLGSKWPTFYLYYEKGIPKLFGSDVNHDYLAAGILHTFKIGTIGTSSYHIKGGQFLNNKTVRDADQKFQRRSDPIWFSNPLYSFQGLDSTLPTQKLYGEAHFVHHDNGAIINKIPFMKKTRIGLVIGAGILYVPERDWLHYEALVGLERNFKFSKRMLRVGIYGTLSDSNHTKPRADFKISFAVLDNRNLKWNF